MIITIITTTTVIIIIIIIIINNFLNKFSGGVSGRVVNTLNSGSGGPGFKPCTLHCFFRQGTLLHFLSLPRCINRYRRHTAGDNPAMD